MPLESKTLCIWQNRILPFAIILMASLFLVFIYFYFIEIRSIQGAFLKPDSYNIISISKQLNKPSATHYDKLYNAELIGLLNRHYSASLVIRSRILILNLSFLTGMILCFMGGLFVLGKFPPNQTSITAATERLNLTLLSSSPGILLTLIGVLLIAISIFNKLSLVIEDKPIYLESYPPINNLPGEAKKIDPQDLTIHKLNKNPFKKDSDDTTKQHVHSSTSSLL